MQSAQPDRRAIAFAGSRQVASGPLEAVALEAKREMDRGQTTPILVFDQVSSEPIDIDWRGSHEEVTARLRGPLVEEPAKGRGRPKLGVVAREVTLLPRHWSWLARQPGGASAALRRLVDQSRQTHREADQIREARQSTYRFITAMAGDEAGYEEATRALFAGDGARFAAQTAGWPDDVRRHARSLAAGGLTADPGLQTSWMPEGREAALTAALLAAFGGEPIQSVERLTGGASPADLWRLRVGGSTYVLRLDGPPDAIRDPARHLTCLKIASDQGLAPRLMHGDPAAGISISAFIAAVPAAPPLSRQQRLRAVSGALSTLHHGPGFPFLVDYFDGVAGLLAAFAHRGVLPHAMMSEGLETFVSIAEIYPKDPSDLVASHNDVNPSNLIFEGYRPWIVDWESAFAAPRYVDLASLATFQATDEADARLILESYFGSPPTGEQSARFYLMRQVNRLFYTVMLLSAADQERSTRLDETQVLAYRLDDIRSSMADLARYEGRVAFGCAFFNQAMQAFQSPAFSAALKAV